MQKIRIVGHTPLALSRIVSSFWKRANHKATTEICGERINRRAGLGLEIPVIHKIYGRRKYLDRLGELIHGSETAKRALQKKMKEFVIDWYVRKYSKMLLGVCYNERENNKIVTLGLSKVSLSLQ